MTSRSYTRWGLRILLRRYMSLSSKNVTIDGAGQILYSKLRDVLYGVNFTTILRAAFTLTDPKSTKKKVISSCFLRFRDL